MDSAMDGVIDFFRVRQLNIVAVVILMISYFVYQRCWCNKLVNCDDGRVRRNRSHSRSGSGRARSPSNYKNYQDNKHRRGRRPHYRRCADCSSVCSFVD